MKPENYLNVIEKLNTELYEAGIREPEIGFQYISNNLVDIIEFMGFQVFYSETDCNIETEYELEALIREKIAKITNDLYKWQKKNLYIIGVDLAKNSTMGFEREYDCKWVGEKNILEKAKFSKQDLKDLHG